MKTPIAIVHGKPEHAVLTYIDWTLLTLCNYACSYCPERLHDGALRGPDIDRAMRLCEALVDHYRGLGRPTFFKFSGGEPTLYKNLIVLMRRIKELGSSTGLNSNGSRALTWWDRATEYLDHVVLTYHVEFTDIDHLVSVANLLLKREVTTHLNVTMLPDRFDECAEHASVLVSRCKGVSIALKPLRVDMHEVMYPYSSAQKKALNELNKQWPAPAKPNAFRGAMRRIYDDGTSQLVQAGELVLLEQNHWSSWRCNAGLESLAIHPDGRVFRAVCKQDGALGNLNDGSVSFPESPVRCTKNACTCLSDIRISKWYGEGSIPSPP